MPTSATLLADAFKVTKVGRRVVLPTVPLAADDMMATAKSRLCTYRPTASGPSVSPVVNEADGPPTPKNALMLVPVSSSALTVTGTLLLAVV